MRYELDKDTAISFMQSKGVNITTVESILFELMKDSKHPSFKTISSFLK